MKPEIYPPQYETYIRRVPEGDIAEILATQQGQVADALSLIPEERGGYRYAADKWTVRDVIGHITDTERVMAYRMLRIGRGDHLEMAGFDEKLFARNAESNRRSIALLTDEFRAVRTATLTLLDQFDESALQRTGTVDGDKISVLGLAYMVAGHTLHHIAILHERYEVAL